MTLFLFHFVCFCYRFHAENVGILFIFSFFHSFDRFQWTGVKHSLVVLVSLDLCPDEMSGQCDCCFCIIWNTNTCTFRSFVHLLKWKNETSIWAITRLYLFSFVCIAWPCHCIVNGFLIHVINKIKKKKRKKKSSSHTLYFFFYNECEGLQSQVKDTYRARAPFFDAIASAMWTMSQGSIHYRCECAYMYIMCISLASFSHRMNDFSPSYTTPTLDT